MTAATLSDTAAADIIAAMGVLPETFWDVNDDGCDCTYVRIGMWTNPYLAETLEVRMCCIWAELYKLFPQYVRKTNAFKDYNRDEWVTDMMEWNGETDMPASLWYRQRARIEGGTIAEMRAKYAGQDPPKGTPRPPAEPQPDVVAILWDHIQRLTAEVEALQKGRK